MTRHPISPTDAIAINAVLFAVRQAADVICDRWVLLLIVAALAGERRFGGFMQRTGMASRVVASRMRTLVEIGLFVRIAYSVRPLRHEYRLTVMGEAFAEVVRQLMRWEQAWARSSSAVASVPVDRRDDMPESGLHCRACGVPATARDIDLRVSRAQLMKIPVKQTLHRRMTRDPAQSESEAGLLGASLDIFGDKWTVEIIICAFFRVRRFGNFRACTGISASILTDRLDRLIAADVLRRSAAPSGAVGRDYRLTDKGIDLFGTLMALQDWADDWVSERYRSPVRFIHRDCGQAFHAAPGAATEHLFGSPAAPTIAFSTPS